MYLTQIQRRGSCFHGRFLRGHFKERKEGRGGEEAKDELVECKNPHERRLIPPYQQSFVSCPILQTLMDRLVLRCAAPKGLFPVESSSPLVQASRKFGSFICLAAFAGSANGRNATRTIFVMGRSLLGRSIKRGILRRFCGR